MAEALRRPPIVPMASMAPMEPVADTQPTVLAARDLSVRATQRVLLRDIHLDVFAGEVLGIIGPSGVGKSTLLKVFNRLIDLESPPLTVTGRVTFHHRSLYDEGQDLDDLRRRIGMLFQQPVIFPASIAANALFGARHHQRLSKAEAQARLEESLRRAALWDEVKDRLEELAATLSVGQQQRLCLARALAVHPEIILMDEPTSALDPRSTEAIEALIHELKDELTLVLVTHDLAQAQRVADRVACICPPDGGDGVGEVIETACCTELFNNPQCRETMEYLRHERRA